MNTKLKFGIFVGLSFLLAPNVFADDVVERDWYDLEDEEKLRDLFINYSELVDPFSVQFRQVKVSRSIGKDGSEIVIWCGHSNQKNKMGAYGGWANFYALEGLQDKPTVKVALGDLAGMTHVMIGVFCKDSGVDGVQEVSSQ